MVEHFASPAGAVIAYEVAGSGPPVLLLHGFPQTRAMWGAIAAQLAERFTVVWSDLRGYGDSVAPDGAGPEAFTFRAMGADQLALMAHLGFQRFQLVGHDRGARVAYRMALDAPERVERLALLDIAPTQVVLEDLSHALAASYFHWFFLAQPEPLPERMIGADPDLFFETCLLGWGGAGLGQFDAETLAAYRAAWRRPEAIAAMCNDYRAAIAHDLPHDRADKGALTCPALVLYGADGVMAYSFDMAAIWRSRLADMALASVPGGHFFPDTAPEATADALSAFLSRA